MPSPPLDGHSSTPILMGLAMALTFFRLGKVAPWDALWYVIAQCVGDILGVVLAATLLRYCIVEARPCAGHTSYQGD